MKYVYLFVSLFIFVACSGNNSQQKKKETEKPTPVFEMVAVPTLITEPKERADYLVTHYWDKFDFADTTYVHFPDVTEQAFSNYIAMLTYAEPAPVNRSLKKLVKSAEADPVIFSYFADLLEKYLYDPNSPTRNEEYYIAVLEALLESSQLDDVGKIRPQHLLELALKNRVGQPATDFKYILSNNSTATLYGVKANYLILYFYNPDCDACKEVTRQIAVSRLVTELINQKELTVLAVYPDEDLTAWKEHLPEMPVKWINGYDKEVTLKNDEVYDLKAIPCLYLLDKNKTVLLKDASYEQLEAYLYHNLKI